MTRHGKRNWEPVIEDIRSHTGIVIEPHGGMAVRGGSINSAIRLETSQGPAFLKLNSTSHGSMFAAEAEGLAELERAAAVRVPRAWASGAVDGIAYLLLEWIDFGHPSQDAARLLGEQLAAQHRVSAPQFGWQIDNTIGSTPQPNGWMDDWIEFYRVRRLRFQLELARRHGAPARLEEQGERLLGSLHDFFRGYEPQPSLLHGDLWGGNWACDTSGHPVIFDPATYYGDREADLAMTELFGGFDAGFYEAYDASWPRDSGYPVRRELYNLYHVLNHFNLFGGGYLRQAEGMIERLLAIAM